VYVERHQRGETGERREVDVARTSMVGLEVDNLSLLQSLEGPLVDDNLLWNIQGQSDDWKKQDDVEARDLRDWMSVGHRK
jgi:hypothetical protein